MESAISPALRLSGWVDTPAWRSGQPPALLATGEEEEPMLAFLAQPAADRPAPAVLLDRFFAEFDSSLFDAVSVDNLALA